MRLWARLVFNCFKPARGGGARTCVFSVGFVADLARGSPGALVATKKIERSYWGQYFSRIEATFQNPRFAAAYLHFLRLLATRLLSF